MLKPYLLTVQLLIGGHWVDGYEVHGWSPREYPSYHACMDRKARAEKFQGPGGQIEDLRWSCVPK